MSLVKLKVAILRIRKLASGQEYKGVLMRSFQHIAKLIRTKRMQHPKGYSQTELSQLLGYKNGQFISNVERGLCNIPMKMLKKVSEILDISAIEMKDAILKDHEHTLDNFFKISPKKSDSIDSRDNASF